MSDIVTVRIPELPASTAYSPDLSLSDKIVIWLNSVNKTVNVDLTTLRSFILSGGGLSHAPVIVGDTALVEVTELEAGTQIFNIPSLAGKDFTPRRSGVGTAMPVNSYEILDAGGFKLLLPGDLFSLGETFELVFHESAGPVVPGAGGNFIIGTIEASTLSFPINNSTHLNRLIQIRGGSNAITVVLPDIADIPENTIIPFETNITNTKQAKITTQAGQNIYFKSTSQDHLYMGVSEMLWLIACPDGWYVINYSGNFMEVGSIQTKYKVGLNELLLDGSTVLRADYPRLWEEVQTFGASLVDDATWLSVDGSGRQPYRGCYSLGDGTTTFRLPNLMNMFIRGIKSTTGTDAERTLNKAGGYQDDMLEAHSHTGDLGSGTQGGHVIPDHFPNDGNVTTGQYTTNATGGVETRGKNIGVLFTVRA